MTTPNIVVLDGHALNPGDLSWEALEALGTLQVYPRTETSKVVERCQQAQVVLTNKSVLGPEQLDQLPELQLISVMATGVNVVDLKHAQTKGIIVSNVVGYSTPSVAQHTFALIMELCNRVGSHSEGVNLGKWAQSPDWSYWDYPLRELQHKVLGIIGLGNIGRQVARIGLAMDMQVVAYYPKWSVRGSGSVPRPPKPGEGGSVGEIGSVRGSVPRPPKPGEGGSVGKFGDLEGVTFVSLEEIFKESDVLSLHCPLNDETHHLVNRKRLSTMKPQAIIINTARGPLINETDLHWALENKVIAAAALDVLSEEPPAADNPLFQLNNCLITPHQAWASWESRSRLMKETVQNVKSFLEGKPRNIVVA